LPFTTVAVAIVDCPLLRAALISIGKPRIRQAKHDADHGSHADGTRRKVITLKENREPDNK